MKVLTTNFNPNSDSGPNSFSRGMLGHLVEKDKISIGKNIEESDIEFCLIESPIPETIQKITRPNGIYFNTSQDYSRLNLNIKKTYRFSCFSI